MVVKVVCLVGLAEILIGYLEGSVMKFDLYGVTKKNRIWVATSGFGLQVMLGRSPCVSGPCALQKYYATLSKLA